MCSTRSCQNGKIVSSNSYFCLYMRFRMPDFVGGTIVPLPRTVVSVSHHYKNPTKRVGLLLGQNGPIIIISFKYNLFSRWYIWKIAELGLNTHSLTHARTHCMIWSLPVFTNCVPVGDILTNVNLYGAFESSPVFGRTIVNGFFYQ